jgi:hypothetical protein
MGLCLFWLTVILWAICGALYGCSADGICTEDFYHKIVACYIRVFWVRERGQMLEEGKKRWPHDGERKGDGHTDQISEEKGHKKEDVD